MSRHNRITDKLRDYWNELRGSRAYPSEREIDPRALDSIWPACFLIDIRKEDDSQMHFHYEYLGDELLHAYGEDIGKEQVSVLIAPNKQRMIDKIHEVVKTGEPLEDESEFVNVNSVLIKYRKIFLPLGDADKGEVNYVFGGIRWRGF